MGTLLPSIPAKRYFTIGEVAELCGVKPHVLRYCQHHEVLMIRRIRDLLYDQGFTISGARNKLQESHHAARDALDVQGDAPPFMDPSAEEGLTGRFQSWDAVQKELFEIRALLSIEA